MKTILEMWNTCELLDWGKPEVEKWIKTINENSLKYKEVEKATGVPAWLVGAIHGRECSFNFAESLANGEPWNRVSRIVPIGIGPFKSWVDAAIYSLQSEHLEKYDFKKIEQCLYFAEKYNGLGYRKMGIPSPYVWGLTTMQKPGKYIADHKWDPTVINKRPGVASIALHFVSRISDSPKVG